jgi:hypothetical protein
MPFVGKNKGPKEDLGYYTHLSPKLAWTGRVDGLEKVIDKKQEQEK